MAYLLLSRGYKTSIYENNFITLGHFSADDV